MAHMDCKLDTLKETQRMEALRRCNILDTPPEPDFDRITHIASSICKVPISLISLVDANRLWFKSVVGLNVSEIPREMSFCSYSVLDPNKEFVVEDASQDSRFSNSPVVAGPPHIRFYAAAPLTLNSGEAIGTLCIVDTIPRVLENTHLLALRYLRDQVMLKVEERILYEEIGGISGNLKSTALSTPMDYSAPIMSCLRLLEQTMDKHSKVLQSKHKITLPQLLCLQSLNQKASMKLLELADILCLSSSTLVGIVDRLEDSKLVVRSRDRVDRRNTHIKITKDGKELLDQAKTSASPLVVSLKNLDDVAQQNLYRALQKVVRSLGSEV